MYTHGWEIQCRNSLRIVIHLLRLQILGRPDKFWKKYHRRPRSPGPPEVTRMSPNAIPRCCTALWWRQWFKDVIDLSLETSQLIIFYGVWVLSFLSIFWCVPASVCVATLDFWSNLDQFSITASRRVGPRRIGSFRIVYPHSFINTSRDGAGWDCRTFAFNYINAGCSKIIITADSV